MTYSKETTKEMAHATMLYKVPGPYKGKGYTYNYIVVDACDEKEFNAALKDGWRRNIAQASGEEAIPVETSSEKKEETKEEEKTEPAIEVEKPPEVGKTDEELSKEAVEKSKRRRGGK